MLGVKLNGLQWSWMIFNCGAWGFATVTFHSYIQTFYNDQHHGSREGIIYWGYAIALAAAMSVIICSVCGMGRRLLKVALVISLGGMFGFCFVVKGQSNVAYGCVVMSLTGYLMSVSIIERLLLRVAERSHLQYFCCVSEMINNAGAAVLLSVIYVIEMRLEQVLGICDLKISP